MEEKKKESRGGEERGEGEMPLSLELEELDVAALMERIRERAEERRRSGQYRERPLAELEELRTGGEEAVTGMEPLHELIFVTQLARQYAEVTSHYPIGARRSPLGPFILLAKKIIRRFMTPYMDAVFAKQREFNAQVLKSLEVFQEMVKRERERRYHGGVDRYTAWVSMDLGEKEVPGLAEAVKRFPASSTVLHPFSGRGEFLEEARRAGREAWGVEEDSRLVRMCQEKMLRVVHAPPLDYLEAQPLDSLDGVFFLDLGERGEVAELLHLVNTLVSRVEREGKVVALNHHPRSVLGTEEAFRDPSLVRLVHPETLAGLFREAGFERVEISFTGDFSPGEKDEWAKRLAGDAGLESGALPDLVFAPRRYILEAGRQ